ncbi:hypothetical protein AaE_015653 [Aphanomyces astaci]|uniref:Uncharacterized protein n=2 Tax=Aphanomyces astaci TaxID=112090 RepID=A0A6A4Z6R2_APHAT|nr:hypothetical protein AaE_015653 [Aphanomyces astaci]
MGRDVNVTKLPQLVARSMGRPIKFTGWSSSASKIMCTPTSKRKQPVNTTKSQGISGPITKPPVQLSALDQRILVLYNSKLRRHTMASLLQDDPSTPLASTTAAHSAEAHHAALAIQRLIRGHLCRIAIHAFFGPINQHNALLIQRHFRGHRGRQRVDRIRARRVFVHARKIQAWVRGVLTRDRLAIALVLDTISKVQLLQRVVRGHRGRRAAHERRFRKHTTSTLTIQRVYRGYRGRERVKHMHYKNQANARAMALSTQRHAVCTRCKGCSWNHATEPSLLACTFARLLGLYDLRGAMLLVEDGLHRFPSHPMFPLLMSVILQVQCASVELAMLYLHKAKTLGLADAVELKQVRLDLSSLAQYCEAKYFFAGLAWQPGNAVMCVVFAIYLQSIGLVKRAESYYKQALNANPLEYPLPAYLARKALCEHIVLNFKRFLCLFKLSPTLHVRLSHRTFTLPTTTGHGTSMVVTIHVSRLNHFAAFLPDNPAICNGLYIADDELSYLLLPDTNHSHGSSSTLANGSANGNHDLEPRQPPNALRGHRKALMGLHHRRRTHGGSSTPKEQALLHEARSTVRLSTEQAEEILNQLVLVPAATAPGSHMIAVQLLPQLQRLREHQTSAMLHYEALVNIQRMYRGHVVRYRKVRVQLCDRIRDDQMYQLQQLLHRRKFLRDERARAATQIQALRRGCVTRRRLQHMSTAATQIQSVLRRQLAKRRVEDIRQGNTLQFPVRMC